MMLGGIIDSFSSVPAGISSLEGNIDNINACFDSHAVEDIFERLQSLDSEWANNTLRVLNKMCPLSLKVTLEAIKRHGDATFTIGDALKSEYRLSQRFMRQQPDSDFLRAFAQSSSTKIKVPSGRMVASET